MIIPWCHSSGTTSSSQTRVKMLWSVFKALPPRKIYSGYTPQDQGALPAFTLFAAAYVSSSVGGHASIRGSGVDAAASDSKATGGGCRGRLSRVEKCVTMIHYYFGEMSHASQMLMMPTLINCDHMYGESKAIAKWFFTSDYVETECKCVLFGKKVKNETWCSNWQRAWNFILIFTPKPVICPYLK